MWCFVNYIALQIVGPAYFGQHTKTAQANSLVTMYSPASTSQLKYHMNCSSSSHIIFLKGFLVTKLFSTENKSYLIHLNTFFLLERLLHCQHRRFSLEVVLLLSPRQCFDEDLHDLNIWWFLMNERKNGTLSSAPLRTPKPPRPRFKLCNNWARRLLTIIVDTYFFLKR